MKVPIPRQHGTWAMLYIPMILALASASGVTPDFYILLICVTALFFLRDPLEALIRSRMKAVHDSKMNPLLKWWSIVFSIIAIGSGGFLVVRGYTFLLVFCFSFIIFLAFHLKIQDLKQDRRIISELIAVAALTSTALLARGVLVGIDQEGFLLWLLCFLFFSSSVFYVKMRVYRQSRSKNSNRITVFSIIFHCALAFILASFIYFKIIGAYVALAYLPILVRSFTGFTTSGKLNLQKIGIAEVVLTILFTIILILNRA